MMKKREMNMWNLQQWVSEQTDFFTNTKSQRNGLIYAKILDELKERAPARGD